MKRVPHGSPVRRRAWLLAPALAALLALASVPASSGSPPDTPATRAATTKVTLSFKNCPECTVRPVRLVQSRGPKARTWPIRKVGADHTVSYRVPTRLTPGMSFFVDAPWHGGDNAAAVLAIRYAGRQVGTRMTPTMARTGRRASGCWAGTDRGGSDDPGARRQVPYLDARPHAHLAPARVRNPCDGVDPSDDEAVEGVSGSARPPRLRRAEGRGAVHDGKIRRPGL